MERQTEGKKEGKEREGEGEREHVFTENVLVGPTNVLDHLHLGAHIYLYVQPRCPSCSIHARIFLRTFTPSNISTRSQAWHSFHNSLKTSLTMRPSFLRVHSSS